MTVSGGGAAGIAIGCLIAGVLLCALAFYLLGRKRRRQQHEADGNVHVEELGVGEKFRLSTIDGSRIQATARPSTTSSSSGSSSSSSDGSSRTPKDASLELETTSDADVKEHFHRLNVAIRGHASLYYSLAPIEDCDKVKFCDANIPTLHEILGDNAPLDAVAMDYLLISPETRIEAIRLLIGWAVFKYIQPDSPVEQTLLPPELVKCAQAMSRTAIQEVVGQARRHSMPRTPILGQPEKPAPRTTAANDRLAFAKWREMSGKLFEPIYGDGTFREGDLREHNIGDLVTVLVCLLQPYVAKGYGGARVRDLENLIKGAAAFGYKLFTRRTEWEFAWSALMSDELVVFPALVKIGDERGNRLRKSVVLDWGETVEMGRSVENLSKRGSLTLGVAIAVAA